ncbi:MAG TPA: response regulator [Microvirga sp.]|jgi:DNA-binding response OmpR family regulator|nr:response regulator [Microvirga sp.]
MIETLSSRTSVLIVEDVAVTAIALSDALEDAGYAVFGHCSSAPDALALLSRAAPDLAILDISLRGGSSGDVARELRRRGVPFLIHSGWSPHADLAAAFEGAIWLEKPVSYEALVHALALVGAEVRPQPAPAARRLVEHDEGG